jgi:hypothetical protein
VPEGFVGLPKAGRILITRLLDNSPPRFRNDVASSGSGRLGAISDQASRENWDVVLIVSPCSGVL